MTEFPIACTLAASDLASRSNDLLPGLVRAAHVTEEIPNGYRLRFKATTGTLQAITSVIDAERQCCRFLRFHLIVEPDNGPVTLDVTGPAGTQEFLSGLVAP